jgi:hypothetical protein
MADEESFDLSGDLDDFLNEDSSSALDLGSDLSSDSVSGIDPIESQLDDAVESSADLVEDAEDLVEDAEDAVAESAVAAPKPKRKGLLSNFSIFDAMLVFSLILVTTAALMMAWGLNDYGSVFGLPWKTTGITVK